MKNPANNTTGSALGQAMAFPETAAGPGTGAVAAGSGPAAAEGGAEEDGAGA